MIMAILTVTDVNGCIGTDSIEVPVSIISEQIDDVLLDCQSGPVALNPVFNAGYSYQWTAQPADPMCWYTRARYSPKR